MVWFNDRRIPGPDPRGLMPLAALDGWLSGLRAPVRPNVPASVYAGDERVLVRVELPGFGPEDVEVTLQGSILSLSGKRSSADGAQPAEASFVRRFRMPYAVDPQQVEARMERGLLEVELARAEADRPRRIEITSARPKSLSEES